MYYPRKFPLHVLVLQIVLIIVYAVFGSYEKFDYADLKLYGYFQDVHIMIFIGFGFLMTFLKRYGFSALGFNMLIAALAVQVCIVMEGMWQSGWFHFKVTFSSLLTADIGAAAVLISFGAVLGRLEPTQLLVMAVIEIALFAANMHIGAVLFGAADAGGSIFVHTFGAYFGLAVARATYNRGHKGDGHELNASVYQSDIMAMVGTLFLWVCWPSFNAALVADEAGQYRAIVNTYLSLAACTMVSFAVSSMVDNKGKLDMVHIQNATLAGGVAVGALANFPIEPWGAMMIGSVAGCLSVVGYKWLTPMMSDRANIVDTCGVHNLHGMPGVFSAVASAVAILLMKRLGLRAFEVRDLTATLPLVAAKWNESIVAAPGGFFVGIEFEPLGQQAAMQMAALGVTLAISLIGGFLTGLVVGKCPSIYTGQLDFDDESNWGLPDEMAPHGMVAIDVEEK